MESIDTCIDQGLQEGLEQLRCLRKASGEILLLPLGPAENEGKVRANFGAAGLDHLNGETTASRHRATVTIGALVRALPEELINQIPMRTMDLYGIKTEALRVSSPFCKGADHVVDILLRHDVPRHFTRHIHPRGRVAIDIALRHHTALTHAATMPELRRDLATFSVNSIDHFFPARQALLTVKIRHVRVAIGRNMVGAGALGNDEANTTGSAAPVILHRGISGHVIR